MSQTYTLDRDGKRPVRFTGILLAEDNGHWINGKDQNRYYTIALYQHEDGRYVVHIEYTTHWQGEPCHAMVYTAATLEEVVATVERFDPLEWVIGYKHLAERGNQPEYVTRQLQLERQITERYKAQIAGLCKTLALVEDL
jgi:hypothetical protein